MTQAAGFADWIEIFRGGTQKDSRGKEHDGDALIERALATFDAAKHEPPIVIGHPTDSAPAWGWIEALRKSVRNEKNVLLAKFRQVDPEFAHMVRDGRFKKRSAAFYPDGSLRHVGFLGAMPPAVKGLADVAFGEGEALSFEFGEEDRRHWESLAGVFRRLREWLIEKHGQDTADRVVPDWEIEDIRTAPPERESAAALTETYHERKEDTMNFKEFIQKLKELLSGVESQAGDIPAGKTFSEAQIEEERKNAAEEAARKEREKLTAEFAERERVARHDARNAEIACWCEAMVKEGKLSPAIVKYGLPQMLAAFAEREDAIEFGEGDGAVKATLYDRLKGLFADELPKLITFSEVATRDKDAGGQGGAGRKLSALTQEKMKANKELTYSAAFAEVQRENIELAREYAAEIQEVK